MDKTKAIVLIIAVSVLLVAFAGIAYSQIVSAQTTRTAKHRPKHERAQPRATATNIHNKDTPPMDNNTEIRMVTDWVWACIDAFGK